MKIGDIAKKSGLPAKTVRYYESIGLIPPAARAANGYRTYSESDLQILKFVQRARGLGFSVEDIASLLALWQDTHRASADVKALAVEHVARIEGKIRELESLRQALDHLAQRCHGDDRPECPIIDELADLHK